MTDTVKGRVQTTSNKPDEDYFGICIDDNWYNGPGSLKENLEEAEIQLEVYTDDRFIDIKEINILEEANEDGLNGRDESNARSSSGGKGSDSGGKTSSKNPKRANIQATAATKKAADIVAEHRTSDEGEFEEQVSVVAHGLNRIINDIYEENMQ